MEMKQQFLYLKFDLVYIYIYINYNSLVPIARLNEFLKI